MGEIVFLSLNNKLINEIEIDLVKLKKIIKVDEIISLYQKVIIFMKQKLQNYGESYGDFKIEEEDNSKKISISKILGCVTFSTTEVAYAMINTVPSSNRSRIDKYVDNKTSINLKKESMSLQHISLDLKSWSKSLVSILRSMMEISP